MEAVASTARWTAAARALETEREDRMFSDPYARELASETGFALLDRYAGAGTVPFLAVRTRYLDEVALEAVFEGSIRQVVFVAAGMDTRAWRLPWPSNTVVYELDRQELLAEKGRLLKDSPLPEGIVRRPVSVDLAGDWAPSLIEAGFQQGEPTVWVMEGLLFFLPEQAIRNLLATLSQLSAAGSLLAGDMASHATVTNPLARKFLNALREDGAAWQFGSDEPEAFLTSCGWNPAETIQPGEGRAALPRWPYPIVPREVSNVPRSFLFTAIPSQR